MQVASMTIAAAARLMSVRAGRGPVSCSCRGSYQSSCDHVCMHVISGTHMHYKYIKFTFVNPLHYVRTVVTFTTL